MDLSVTLLQRGDQVLGPLDKENARVVEGYMKKHGVNIVLGDGAAAFKEAAKGGLDVVGESGKIYHADVVILAIGVRPDTTLAKMAGLEIGERGGIRVDDQMHTSDPDIFAVGDAVEVKDFMTGEWSLVASCRASKPSGPYRSRCDCRA